MLGLSATPKRKDGLQWVFESFIGPIVYMTKDIITDGVEVNIIDHYSDDINYNKECLVKKTTSRREGKGGRQCSRMTTILPQNRQLSKT